MMMMMVLVLSNGYHATRDLQTVASPGGGRQERAVAVVNGGEWELRGPRQRLSMFWPSVCSTAVHRAAVGQWAGVEDETTWGVMSSVGMSASVAKANDIKWPPTVKRAAVLLCLFKGSAGEFRVILTKRAGTLSSHSGEVALPGGKRDEEDEDDAATALREAQEEIGLEPSQVRVVAVFEPFLSKHLLAVTPVVGLLRENSKFIPTGNPAEVESIFDAPLEMFLKDEAHRYKDQIWQDTVYRVHFFNFETLDGVKYSIWGLTASILIRAACVIFQRQPAFMEVAPHSVNFSKKGGENPKN
ncbi:unnamed protein product [Sphagnum jensenii]|uniref:Nudix hydrolase domain-containing protein n=1 Tax=Sphagnum jensenii TaxID=128206 RepID=A0ABP1BCH5_9BRYO